MAEWDVQEGQSVHRTSERTWGGVSEVSRECLGSVGPQDEREDLGALARAQCHDVERVDGAETYGETWGDMGRSQRHDVERVDGAESYGETWGDMGRSQRHDVERMDGAES